MKIKTYKKDLDYSYTLGIYLTIELLTYKPHEVICVFISSQTTKSEGVEKIINLCEKNHITVEESDKIINKLSPKQNCYAIGIFKKFETTLEEEKNHIVLVNPSDSGNLGTILRTGLGFHLNNVAIIKPGVDIFDPKTIRASMGAIFSVNFRYYDSFEDYQKIFTNHDLYTFMLNAKYTLHDIKIKPNDLFSLVFGNEARGLDEEFEQVGTGVIIPHLSSIDSLNLSIAAGIAMYEFTKVYF